MGLLDMFEFGLDWVLDLARVPVDLKLAIAN